MSKRRPITTHYTGGYVGHATTPKRTILAAARCLIVDGYRAAHVYDERGQCIASLSRAHAGVQIIYLRPRSIV